MTLRSSSSRIMMAGAAVAALALAFASPAAAAGTGSNGQVIVVSQVQPGQVQVAGVDADFLTNNVTGGEHGFTAQNVEQAANADLTQDIGSTLLPAVSNNNITYTSGQQLTGVATMAAGADVRVVSNVFTGGANTSTLAANVGQLSDITAGQTN